MNNASSSPRQQGRSTLEYKPLRAFGEPRYANLGVGEDEAGSPRMWAAYRSPGVEAR